MANLTATFLRIANRALITLGEEPIATFDPDAPSTTNQKAIAYNLQEVCDQVLAMHPWASASTWYTFDSDDDATEPAQSLYTIAYNLPTGFIRFTTPPLISGYVYTDDAEPPAYSVSGSLFLTYTSGWEIEYVKTQTINAATDTIAAAWSKPLQSLITAHLAYLISPVVVGGNDMKKITAADLEYLFREAVMADSANVAPQQGYRGVLAGARFQRRDA